MSKPLPWFRLHAEAIDDSKLKLLAFEDRWHFVALMCCKCQGILDRKNPDLVRRMVAAKMGLDKRELDEVARRLAEVDLIDQETLQPLNWDSRQYVSDNSTERVRRHRERQKKQEGNDMKRYSNVSETPPESDTDTDTDTGEAFALNGAKPAPAEEPPYEQIKDLYNQLCPSLKTCRKMTPKRRKAIRRLWKTDAPTIEHWKALFEDCENRDAWAGRLEPRPPYEHPFRANFDFVVDEENIAKVLESE